MTKLSRLERISLSDDRFPRYVAGYETCVVRYEQTKRSQNPEVTLLIDPEDAVYLRTLFDKRALPVPSINDFAYEKITRLENLGLIERDEFNVTYANRAKKAKYTFIPR